MTTMTGMVDRHRCSLSGRIMEFEIRENRERIDTGIYSKGWNIIFRQVLKRDDHDADLIEISIRLFLT